jgi:phosphate-selective porin
MHSIVRAGWVSLALIIVAGVHAEAQVPWNGYMQLRFSNDYRSAYGFAVRRAVVWVQAPAPFAPAWSFKIQGLFRYQNKGAYTLQDAYAEYHYDKMILRLGQQTPDFSLQRQQPDAEIPFVERAIVVDALIPSAETDGRDIGLQIQLNSKSSAWHWSAGTFNGNGGNTAGSGGKHLIATSRLTFAAALGDRLSWENGMSASYRDVSSTTFARIFGNGQTYSGSDFRGGLESHLSCDSLWDVQAEFLQARLNDRLAWGGYGYCDVYVTKKDLIVLSYDYFHDLGSMSPDVRGVDLTWSHFLVGHKAKFILDNRVERLGKQTDYLTTGQFQLFLH